jgi:Tfp pilus assembly protein PilF
MESTSISALPHSASDAHCDVRTHPDSDDARARQIRFRRRRVDRSRLSTHAWEKLSEAIEVFKFSVGMFPKSYNTYDSLAEAYMDNVDTNLATQKYQKSLQLNLGNTNATEMLEIKKLNSK